MVDDVQRLTHQPLLVHAEVFALRQATEIHPKPFDARRLAEESLDGTELSAFWVRLVRCLPSMADGEVFFLALPFEQGLDVQCLPMKTPRVPKVLETWQRHVRWPCEHVACVQEEKGEGTFCLASCSAPTHQRIRDLVTKPAREDLQRGQQGRATQYAPLLLVNGRTLSEQSPPPAQPFHFLQLARPLALLQGAPPKRKAFLGEAGLSLAQLLELPRGPSSSVAEPAFRVRLVGQEPRAVGVEGQEPPGASADPPELVTSRPQPFVTVNVHTSGLAC
mmetsp:Transcript_60237/g.166723  ORF Transcript_60237/g.166723 Transcript_60237/m.166723 type:complete len:277 (+) Transcript_60237:477-1307(+)